MIRFLNKNEYAATIPLFIECFGDDAEFMEEYYGSLQPDGSCSGNIRDGLIAVLEQDGSIVSMVQVLFFSAVYTDSDLPSVRTDSAASGKASGEPGCAVSSAEYTSFLLPYILGVCTKKCFRHRGYMDRVMNFVTDYLTEQKYPFCFLIPVDQAIYRHLGFTTDQSLEDMPALDPYTDDGLEELSLKLLNSKKYRPFNVVSSQPENPLS